MASKDLLNIEQAGVVTGRQEPIQAIGMRSTAHNLSLPFELHLWSDAAAAIGIARRAVKEAHDNFVEDLKHIQMFASPSAVRVTRDYKRGELVLVASSNRFTAKPIGDTVKKGKQVGTSLGNISQHEVFILKHWLHDNEKDEKAGKGEKEEKDVWQAPYWIVPEHGSVHNMKHTTYSVEVPMATDTMCTVAVPTMTNTKGVKTGEYLVVQSQKRKREE